jgi:hypothetical protein
MAEQHDGPAASAFRSEADFEEVAEFAPAMTPHPASQGFRMTGRQVHTPVDGRFLVAGRLNFDK